MGKKSIEKEKHKIQSTNYTRATDKESIRKLAHELYVLRQQKLKEDTK